MTTLDIKPTIGSYVVPDGWNGWGDCLIPCDDWDKAEFRFPARTAGYDLAVNVEVTGKKERYVLGMWAVRVRITYVGDGEPDQHDGGFMKV